MPTEYRPGPGTYDPKDTATVKGSYIKPLVQAPNTSKMDRLALEQFQSKQKFFAELSEAKARHPPPGTYDAPSSFVPPSPRSGRCKEGLHGTPRSDRFVLSTDLFERSRMPGPGAYTSNGIGGRDRLYRKKLALERINYMCPTLPPIVASPRRTDENQAQ